MNQDSRTTPSGDSPEEREIASRVASGYAALDREEPPAALDAAILAAAHRAVGARPQTAGSATPWRWQRPLAWAAVVVMTASIGLMVFEDYPQRISDPQSSFPSADDVVPAVPSPAAPARERSGTLPAERIGERASEDSASAAPPELPQVRADKQVQRERESRIADRPFSLAKPGDIAGATRHERSATETSQPDQAKRSNEAAQDASEVVPSPAQGAASPAPRADPHQKLAMIEALIREGKREAARRALADLRQEFPEFPVPDDIRRQLELPDAR